jgi:hypothetical protein
MRRIPILLWGVQFAAIAIALIAALAAFESIVVAGPALSAAGLLLGSVTSRYGNRPILIYALSAPLVCSLCALLIAANSWGPSEAARPITTIIVAYTVVSAPCAIVALKQIHRTPDVKYHRKPWQFSLKSMLMATTAVCVLIGMGQLMVAYLPDYPWRIFDSYWFGFGGFAFLSLALSAWVWRRYDAARQRNIRATAIHSVHEQSASGSNPI